RRLKDGFPSRRKTRGHQTSLGTSFHGYGTDFAVGALLPALRSSGSAGVWAAGDGGGPASFRDTAARTALRRGGDRLCRAGGHGLFPANSAGAGFSRQIGLAGYRRRAPPGLGRSRIRAPLRANHQQMVVSNEVDNHLEERRESRLRSFVVELQRAGRP